MTILADPAVSGNGITPDPIELPLGSDIENNIIRGNNSAETTQSTFAFSLHPDDFIPDRMSETEGAVVKEVYSADYPGWCTALRGWLGIRCSHSGVGRAPIRCSKCAGCRNRWRQSQQDRILSGLFVAQDILVLDMTAAPGRCLQTAHAEFIRDARQEFGANVAGTFIRPREDKQRLILRDVPYRTEGWWQRFWRKRGGTYQIKVKRYTGRAAVRRWEEILAPLWRLRFDPDRKSHSRLVGFTQNWKPSGTGKAGPETPVLRPTRDALWYSKFSPDPLFRGEVVNKDGRSSRLFPPHIAITDRGLLVEEWGPDGPCECFGNVLPDIPVIQRLVVTQLYDGSLYSRLE